MEQDRDHDAASQGPEPGGQSRREFLQRSLGGAAALGVGGFLADRGLDPRERAGHTGEARRGEEVAHRSKPKRGGTLRLATSGGSSSDTLDANACVNNADFARAPQLYDTLMEFDANAVPKLALADEVTPNKTATEWTIRVRKGVEFHDGKPLDIDDVLFTFNRIVKGSLSGAAGLAFMNLKDAKKLDSRTVRIPMKKGYSILPLSLVGDGEMSIVPVGYDPKKPIGTGAFRMNSKKAYFSPGRESLFERNDHYWRSGQPYFDAVQITEYTSEQAQVDAMESNQADCCDQLSIQSIAPLKNAGLVVKIWGGPGWVPFTMRLDKKPFNDVNVRNALRYACDREQMRRNVYGGYGLIGNDVFGIDQPDYDKALTQRKYDPKRAKALLKKAGHDKLNVTLVTSPIKTGAVELATVFKQNAAAAGINITLKKVNSTVFFGPNYLKWTFAQDWWSGYPYLRQAGYSMVTGAPWDETHWNASPYYAKYFKLYEQALKTVDAAKQTDIVHELMKMDWEEGGYIIPVFNPIIVGQSKKLSGVTNQKDGDPWIQYQFRSLWFS